MPEPILSARSVTKTYRMGEVDVPALRDVTLDLLPGEFVALTGPSGSGKSTLLNVFSGLTAVNGGQILVNGKDLAEFSTKNRSLFLAETCGYIFQTFNLVHVLTAVENVELPLWQSELSRKEIHQRAMDMLEKVGLQDRADHRPAQLSGGQQQRVAIARALVHAPRILFADEPTANLDAKTSEQIMALMQELNQTMDCLCLVSTHDPDLVAFAEREVRLRDGKVVQ